MNIQSKLLKDRIVLVGLPIDDTVAKEAIAAMLYLQSQDSSKPISLYVNSPGGAVTAGLAILDTMRLISPDVHTYVIGQAHSMAAVLLAHGAAGHRFAMANSAMSVSMPTGELENPEAAKEIERMAGILVHMMAEACSTSVETMRASFEVGLSFNPVEARLFGLVDEVVRVQEP